jgi:hypothetical protein
MSDSPDWLQVSDLVIENGSVRVDVRRGSRDTLTSHGRRPDPRSLEDLVVCQLCFVGCHGWLAQPCTAGQASSGTRRQPCTAGQASSGTRLRLVNSDLTDHQFTWLRLRFNGRRGFRQAGSQVLASLGERPRHVEAVLRGCLQIAASGANVQLDEPEGLKYGSPGQRPG